MLSTITTAAALREWRTRLDVHIQRLGELTSEHHNTKELLDFLHTADDPWKVEGIASIALELPPAVSSQLRTLKSDAQKIVSRKTVFLMPDYQPDLGKELPTASMLIEKMANELARISIAPYGFLRLAPPASDTKSEELGLMAKLVKHLMIAKSSLILKNETRFCKEGALLMDGPTGAGKSLAAELIALHQRQSFIKVNIAAINDELLEGRMRGYRRGSFTGAVYDHHGWFAQANGGILFLDEFQNASLATQTQLLDLLDPVSNEVQVSRIGDDSTRKYRVKVILAVNRPVHELLAVGRLREDLFFRIRDVARLKGLNDLLSESSGPTLFSMLVGWIYLYRWKSAPYLGRDAHKDAFAAEDDCLSLFPDIDEGIVSLIRDFQWKGNFRQLERVITDLLWRNDEQRRNDIDVEGVLQGLAEENERLGQSQRLAEIDEGQRAMNDRIALVEKILLRNDFNIARSLRELNPLKISLGSRPSLKVFLRRHLSSMSPEVRAQSSLIKFLRPVSS